MVEYSAAQKKLIPFGDSQIASFINREGTNENIDWKTVESFGEEWSKFHEFSMEEIKRMGDQYFDIVTDKVANQNTEVLDMGCGSGRWSKYLAGRVKFIEAIDPSSAVFQAAKILDGQKNVRVTQAGVDNIPFPDNSFDLVFSLGVLHHIPDTRDAMKKCVRKVKPGGYFLVYLYYKFDNRTALFKFIYYLSNLIRIVVCRFPSGLKKVVCDVLAVLIYLPFVMLAKIFDSIGFLRSLVRRIPLSYYRNKSFQVIRNDSLDRFGTPLEQRFTRNDIKNMMTEAGLTDIVFSEHEPYWHAIGIKK